MTVTHDIRDQIEKIDEQIVDLLAQRVTLMQESLEDEEPLGPETDIDTIAQWEGMAEERDWNMTTMANICKWVLKLCRNVGE